MSHISSMTTAGDNVDRVNISFCSHSPWQQRAASINFLAEPWRSVSFVCSCSWVFRQKEKRKKSIEESILILRRCACLSCRLQGNRTEFVRQRANRLLKINYHDKILSVPSIPIASNPPVFSVFFQRRNELTCFHLREKLRIRRRRLRLRRRDLLTTDEEEEKRSSSERMEGVMLVAPRHF